MGLLEDEQATEKLLWARRRFTGLHVWDKPGLSARDTRDWRERRDARNQGCESR